MRKRRLLVAVVVLVLAVGVLVWRPWVRGDVKAIRAVMTALAENDAETANEYLMSESADAAALRASNERAQLRLRDVEKAATWDRDDRDYKVTYTLGDEEFTTTVTVRGDEKPLSVDGLTADVELVDRATGRSLGQQMMTRFLIGHHHLTRSTERFDIEGDVLVTGDGQVPVDATVTDRGHREAREALRAELDDCARAPSGSCPGVDLDRGQEVRGIRATGWEITSTSPGRYGGPATLEVLIWPDEDSREVTVMTMTADIRLDLTEFRPELVR